MLTSQEFKRLMSNQCIGQASTIGLSMIELNMVSTVDGIFSSVLQMFQAQSNIGYVDSITVSIFLVILVDFDRIRDEQACLKLCSCAKLKNIISSQQ